MQVSTCSATVALCYPTIYTACRTSQSRADLGHPVGLRILQAVVGIWLPAVGQGTGLPAVGQGTELPAVGLCSPKEKICRIHAACSGSITIINETSQ